MNKTWLKNVLRLIKQTKGRFISLMAIVAIGVAFFVGVSGSSPIMGYSVDAYDDKENLKDLTLYSNLGFDKADLQAIASVKGVKKVEGTYFADVLAACKNSTYVTRIHAYNPNQTINRVVLKKGRMPKNEHEALAENGSELESGFALGSTVSFYNDQLKIKKVKIVGTVDTPLYLNQTKENSTLSDQPIRTYLYVPEAAFSSAAYTEVNVLTDHGKDLYAFSDAYQKDCEKVKKRIEKLAKTQAKKRYDSLQRDALRQIEEQEQNLLDGKAQLDQGQNDLNENQRKLDQEASQQKANLEINWALLEQKQAELNQAYAQLNTQKQALSQALSHKAEMENGLTTISSSLTELNQSLSAYQTITSAIEKMDASIQALDVSIPYPDESLLKDCPGLESFMEQFGLTEESTIADLKQKVSDQKATLIEQKQDLEIQKEAIEKAWQEKGITDPAAMISTLQAQQAQLEGQLAGLNQFQNQMDQAQVLLDTSANQLASAKVQWQQGSNTLAQTLAESQKALDEAKTVLTQKAQELQDGTSQIDQAKEKIYQMEPGKWTVLDRESHYASVTYKATVDQMAAIGKIFPVFFILVAALVCMTTMKRMVDEQRGEIGTLRALGYTRMQCAMKYLLYASLATLLGEVIGSILGLLTFPSIIYNTWRMMYILPDMVHFIPWNLIVISCVAFLVGMLLTCYGACRSDMKEVPSQLMRPKAPKLGKNTLLEKIPFLWKRFSFNTKVTVRNIFRYKHRFVLTVIGVAGCSALLVTGFGIRDSIKDLVDLQFHEIYKYDGYAQVENTATNTQAEQLLEKIQSQKQVKSAHMIYMYNSQLKTSKGKENLNVQVFKNQKQANECVTLRKRKDKKALKLTDKGILLSEKLAENMHVKVGDSITVEAENGVKKKIPVVGLTEMYVHHSIFMTEACYENYFGNLPETKTILIKIKGSQKVNEDFQKALVDYPNVEGITFYDATLSNFKNMVEGLDVIVWAIIISSMLLAFVVLSNLIQVNISERQREIATLKVLGFRKKEVKSYIFRENNVLVFLGAVCGIPIGCALHHFIMNMVEMDYVMFGRQISLYSFGLAIVLTMLFGFLVELFMTKRLQNIQMVDSLKSVE